MEAGGGGQTQGIAMKFGVLIIGLEENAVSVYSEKKECFSDTLNVIKKNANYFQMSSVKHTSRTVLPRFCFSCLHNGLPENGLAFIGELDELKA